MTALLAALFSFAAGAVAGAALQRWGDGVRASGHLGTDDTWTEPDGTVTVITFEDLAGHAYEWSSTT